MLREGHPQSEPQQARALPTLPGAIKEASPNRVPPRAPTFAEANVEPKPKRGSPRPSLDGAISAAEPIPQAPRPEDALLVIYADLLDDLEQTRIAMTNRIHALREVKGMDDTPEEERLIELGAQLERMERAAVRDLRRAVRLHPLGPWIDRTVGIGEKQGARLLAAIGDPGTRPNVAKLWAYCGFAPGQKLRKGERANWNPVAKMRARLCAESCIKQAHSPFRPVYDAAREQYADRDTTDLHKHNMALRRVAKEILKALWVEARAAR